MGKLFSYTEWKDVRKNGRFQPVRIFGELSDDDLNNNELLKGEFQKIPKEAYAITIHSDTKLHECDCEKFPISDHVAYVDYVINDYPSVVPKVRPMPSFLNNAAVVHWNQQLQDDINEEEQIKIDWENKQIALLNKLTDTVRELIFSISILHCEFNSFKKIITNTPKHITSISLPSCFSNEIIELFASLPSHITKVDITELGSFTKEQQKLYFIHLPVSVKTIVVRQGERCLENNIHRHLEEYRKANYFPDTYEKMANEENGLLNQARAILSDYTKDNSLTVRFFTCCLGRNHVAAVHALLSNQSIQSFDDLYHELNAIVELNKENGTFNPVGSLARRVRYIELLMERAHVSVEKKKIDVVSNHGMEI